MNNNFLINVKGISKSFQTKAGVVDILKNVDLRVAEKEFVTIMGKSGSGKSTLLNIIAGIDKPSVGELVIDNSPIHKFSESRLSLWRGKNVGVVFQFFQLLPTLTVIENIMLPMDFCNFLSFSKRKERALALLQKVGMEKHSNKLPDTLSGGEQQRVAIARALANDPSIIIADEPTGNLDSHTAASIMELFGNLSKEGKTVLMVTHERNKIEQANRTILLSDGEIVSDK